MPKPPKTSYTLYLSRDPAEGGALFASQMQPAFNNSFLRTVYAESIVKALTDVLPEIGGETRSITITIQ